MVLVHLGAHGYVYLEPMPSRELWTVTTWKKASYLSIHNSWMLDRPWIMDHGSRTIIDAIPNPGRCECHSIVSIKKYGVQSTLCYYIQLAPYLGILQDCGYQCRQLNVVRAIPSLGQRSSKQTIQFFFFYFSPSVIRSVPDSVLRQRGFSSLRVNMLDTKMITK